MELLTIKEAAGKIKMSEGWVKKAIREGELPVIRFGRSVRIFEEQLVRYCKKFEVETQSLGGSWPEQVSHEVHEKSVRYRP